MLQPITEVVMENVTDELGQVAIGCQKFGLVCTPTDEFNRFTIWIAIIGIILGVIFTLLFQYTRKKTKEKIAKVEAERLAELAKQAEYERRKMQ